MNASTSPPSIWIALRQSASAGLQACRQLSGAVRAETSTVTAAVAEHRGVVRSACMAVEQTGRAAIRITRVFTEQSVAAWCGVPLIGTATGWIIVAVARIAMGLLSVLVAAMIASDVLLNTAAEWRTLHPRVR